MVKYKALPLKDIDRLKIIGDEVPISEVFLDAFEFVRLNIKDKKFMEYLKSNMGCSFDNAYYYITFKRDKIKVWSELKIFKMVDEETSEINGYTLEPFIELLVIIKKWRKQNQNQNNKTMEEVKERIKPVNFNESNRTLKGGKDADDLRVFADGTQSVSCWKLTFIGALKLLFTRKVWLGVLSGNSQPPVWMSTDYPFKKK